MCLWNFLCHEYVCIVFKILYRIFFIERKDRIIILRRLNMKKKNHISDLSKCFIIQLIVSTMIEYSYTNVRSISNFISQYLANFLFYTTFIYHIYLRLNIIGIFAVFLIGFLVVIFEIPSSAD